MNLESTKVTCNEPMPEHQTKHNIIMFFEVANPFPFLFSGSSVYDRCLNLEITLASAVVCSAPLSSPENFTQYKHHVHYQY
jgi:hypothetical protein